MIFANAIESAEHLLQYYMPENFLSNFGPCAVGLSATAFGLYLGNLFTTDDSLVEFHKHLENESYLQEIQSMFLKKDHFFQLLQMAVLGFTCAVLLFLIFLFYLTNRYLSLKNFTNENFMKTFERVQNVERVVESILADHEVLDMKQIEFFKTEIEQQRAAFKDFITNRSLEFETTVSEAKSICLKAKTSAHNDLKKLTELNGQASELKVNIDIANSSLEETRSQTSKLNREVEKLTTEIDQKLENIRSNITNKFSDLNEAVEEDKVEIYKCNALLLCSQTLFEACIFKFEELDLLQGKTNQVNSQDDEKPSAENIVPCLERAIELNNFLKTKDETSMEKLSDFSEDFCKTNKNSENAMLFELLKRLEIMEEKVCRHYSLINGNNVKIKHLEFSTSEKISDLKYCSDEWITSWVSVIYGLFNSSFLHLENQLFGIDCLEYTTIFDVSDDKIDQNSNLFYHIMDQCKQSCLKIVKEINLLIFEYYLVQSSLATASSSLLSMCNTKIDDELETLFAEFRQTVDKTPMANSKRTDIVNTLARLRQDLTSDLKDDTMKFNALVKQNLEDFCIIHDTMKTIFKETDKRRVQTENDSVLEVSDNSNSLLSLHEDSSFSENEDSVVGTLSNESVLRPFKLSLSKKKK
ncbi:hypothetical protein PICMEDRAFT_71621 [Pichia membranifaciens NRRL Y-2026]|uniref:Uncharacterized protein n=1 Tax=Pichia membranifaciens NRRL Y-2026 TaxID=763406 RepID=A0A1E3NPU1_9ASCO|nr:hypothetical protein PICMEDRAFT_71621 [Pichia membranifaciens NRRL Y-2026]ODQ47563.1 hypothetical protein PICMEDRAFT_71621 [Pichia membranifaciens NRRL Y-2026]